ncbi:MAG: CCA tRNA nucleotidyltransferase [Clostridia bacterium]|nr:CCA tRNA nucleotidyltransferase [Clostridia bacterium]
MTETLQMHFPDAVMYAMERLNAAGFRAAAVGGCVRDTLLGAQPHDFDLTTSALPEEMKKVFANDTLKETGIRLGTLTLVRDGMEVEITTFRTDGDYLDGRHPEGVRFTTELTEDLARRDFTVNAMAWEYGVGLRDPFNGLRDIESKLIRCVGNAARRFEEDALRMLRAVRFAARLGFSLEGSTARALEEKKERVAMLSRERICDEITGMLVSPFFLDAALNYGGVLLEALPELKPMKGCPQECIYHSWDVWEHSLRTVDLSPPDPVVRWAALLHDCGKPETHTRDADGVDHFYGHPAKGAMLADRICAALNMPSSWRSRIHMLVLRHDERFSPGDMLLLASRIGLDNARDLCLLHMADQGAHSPMVARRARWTNALLDELDRIERDGDCWNLEQLAVSGRDMLALGISGPAVGEMLHYLLEAVVRFHVPNDRDLLMQAAKAHYERMTTAFGPPGNGGGDGGGKNAP